MDTGIVQDMWRRVIPIILALIVLLGGSILTGCSEEPSDSIVINYYEKPPSDGNTTCVGIINNCD